MPDTEIPRDRYGRPLIIPIEGGDPGPYNRASGVGKTLDDLTGLMLWKARKTAEGLIRRPDLLTGVAGIIANGDPDTDRNAKRDLNRICDQAQEAAGASKGSTAGTGFHSLTEAIDKGQEPLFVPDADRVRLEAYKAATASLEMVDIETFIVNDDIQAAGTFDRLVRLPDGRVVVADLKSGKSEADYPLSTTVQIATYAHGLRYDPETGARSPLHPDLDVTTGILIHLPPSGGCRLFALDLERGWRAALVAYDVARIRKLKADDLARELVTA